MKLNKRFALNVLLLTLCLLSSVPCILAIRAIAQLHWPPFQMDQYEAYLHLLEQIDWEVIALHTLPFFTLCLLTIGINRQIFHKKNDTKNSHGSARFATISEIKEMNSEKGIPVGLVDKGKIVRLNPDHVVLVAPSGSGKGVGIIIPTLLDYSGPVVVTDIKAVENFYVTARYRRSQGREIYVMDTDHLTPQESVMINVLDMLDPTSPKIVEDVGILASILRPIPQHDSENTKYFAEQSLALIQCLILYVLCSPKISPDQKNLPFIYDLLCQESDQLTELFQDIKEDTNLGYGTASRLAAAVLSTTERELSGVYNSARQELRVFDGPILRQLTSSSSVDLREIINNKADLYICVPSEAIATQGRLVRLLISVIFLLLKKQRQKPKHPILMVLDEMPLLGSIPEVEKALIIGRGYGVKLMCVAQTIELLSSTYPKAWKTMLASNLSLFIGASDNDTAKYISEKLGQKTVTFETMNTGKSRQKGSIKANTSKSEGESVNYAARPLLTPDEVAALGDDKVLAFMRGHRPMLLNKIKYYEHREWEEKWDLNRLEQ